MADDVIFNVQGDSTSAIGATQNLINILTDLDNLLQKIGDSMGIFDDLAKSLDNLYSAANLATAGVEALWRQTEEAATAIDASTKSLLAFNDAASNLGTNSGAIIGSITGISDSLANLSDIAFIALDDLTKIGAVSAQAASDMSGLPATQQAVASTAQQLSTNAAQATGDLLAQASAAQDLDAQLKNLEADEQQDAQDLNQLTQAIDSADSSATGLLLSAQDLEQAFGNLLNTIEEATLGIKDMGQQALTAASEIEDSTLAVDSMTQAMGAQNAMFASVTTASSGATMGMVGFGNAARTAETEASPMNDLFGPGAMNLILMATAIGMVGGSFLKMGLDAEDAIAHISGLADQSLSLAANSGKLQNIISQLSQDAEKYGVTLGDAAKGMYFIISAGFPTSEAIKVLSASMEAAAATGTQMDIVSNALTSVLNAYGLSGNRAKEVTDKMVQAVVSGKQEFSAFANAIGPVAASAAHAGVSISEMFAAEDALTQINPRVRQDAQQLANLFNTLSNNGQKIVDTAKSMGAHLTLASFEAMPLIDKLELLAKIAKGDTTPAFRELLQNQTAATAAFDLLRNKGQSYIDMLDTINHAMGATDTAFQETAQTITFQWQKVQAILSVISYQFVVLIGPVVTPILQAIGNAAQFVANHFDTLKPIIAGIAVALGSVLVGAVVALIGFMGLLAGPIVGVATAIGLITAAIIAVYPHLQQFQAWVNTVFPGLSILWSLIQAMGLYISGAFNAAWANLQPLLAQISTWFEQHITPAVQQIIKNFIDLAIQIASRVLPAMDQFIKTTLVPLAENIRSKVVPALEKFIEKVMDTAVYISGHMPQILDQLSKDLDKVKEVLLIVGGALLGFRIAIAVGAAGGIVAFLTQAAGPLIAFFSTGLPQALAAAGAALAGLATPFGLVAIIVATLLGYFVYLTTQSKELQNAWKSLSGPLTDVWKALQAAIGDVVKAFNDDLKPALKDALAALAPLKPAIDFLAMSLGVGLIAILGTVIELLASLITVAGKAAAGLIQAVKAITDGIKDVVKFLQDFQKALDDTGKKAKNAQKDWAQVGEDVKKIFGDMGNFIMAIWHATFDAVMSGVLNFVANIIKFFTSLSNALVGHSIIPDMLNAIVQAFAQFPQKVVSIIQKWVQDVINAVQKMADQIVGHSIIPDMLNKIVQLFSQLPQQVGQAVNQFVQTVIQAVGQLAQQMVQNIQQGISGFVQALQQGLQNAVQFVQQGIEKISQPLKDLGNQAAQWGKDFIGGFSSGIQGAMSGLLSSVMGMAMTISSYLHFSKPDIGPLSDADQWGPDFGDMLASGLNSQIGKVSSAAKNIASSISGATPNAANFSVVATNTGAAEQTMVLRQILAELRNGNQGSAANRGTIGYQIPSTELGAINQQFNYYNGSTNAATLYNQINTLGGLAQEYSARGSISGLGF